MSRHPPAEPSRFWKSRSRLSWPVVLRCLLDHRYTGAHASEYVDGELSAPGRTRVERHTSMCPKCREVIASLRRTLTALPRLRVAPGSNLADAVIDRLRREH